MNKYYPRACVLDEIEMFGYTTDLHSLTHEGGTFVMEFYRYEEVPEEIAGKILPTGLSKCSMKPVSLRGMNP